MALPPFLETLQSVPLVFDGAMGTLLYERGVYLDKSFDELVLTRAPLVAEVHKDYLDVGADVIQTNTYGANPMSLRRHGLEEKHAEIVAAAVRIAKDVAKDRAYVVGSVGPTGLLPKDLLRNRTRREAFEAFRAHARALVDEGVDGVLFETFGFLGELEIAIEAAYDVRVPLIGQVSFDETGKTLDGASTSEVKDRLLSLGVNAIGANCVLGPERLLEIVVELIDGDTPIIMQPNAGSPRVVDGRSIYQSSPETFGVVARRAYKLGVRAVGGCCGTTPDHIRRVVAACRMMGGGRWRRDEMHEIAVKGRVPLPPAAVPLVERSRFGAKIARGEFAVSVEVSPPQGLDPTSVLEKVRRLEGAGIDVVNIPDGPRATVRMSNIAFAKRVLETSSIEPLVHFCGRDRNLLGLQSDLLGAWALGVKNLVVITGDPPKVGDYPDATAVFDLDAIGLLQMASGLNRGFDPAGKPIQGATGFVLATGAEPAALDFEREVKRLADKKEAGAELVMTQPVYDPAVLERFLDAIAPLALPVLVGIIPLASSRNAEFLHQNVPGMRVPDEVRRRMAAASDQRREGIAIAVETLRAVKARVQGAYIMPPFGRLEAAAEIVAEVR